MSDLIRREDAIKAMSETLERVFPAHQQIAEKCINALPSAEPRWIPVSERLPEINEHHVSDVCLVYLDDGAKMFSELKENIFGQRFWGYERGDGDDYYETVGEVIAWMPLPEPYRKENHE